MPAREFSHVYCLLADDYDDMDFRENHDPRVIETEEEFIEQVEMGECLSQDAASGGDEEDVFIETTSEQVRHNRGRCRVIPGESRSFHSLSS